MAQKWMISTTSSNSYYCVYIFAHKMSKKLNLRIIKNQLKEKI